MELLGINDINNKFLLYKDMRSVVGFLKTAGLSIIKLGRGRWIKKEDFDAFIAGLINHNNTNSDLKTNKYQPIGKTEKQFSRDLHKFYTKL